MALVYIGLGSNLGDGRENIKQAWQRLQGGDCRALTLSSPYLTEPVGMESKQLFTNAVGLVETDLAPEKMLARMLAVEALMGRDRQQGRDRIVDLDILYYDDLILQSTGLVIPHPEIGNRLFVLAPLAEIAPDYLHPALKRSSSQMQRKLDIDGGEVKKITWENA